MRSLLLIFFLLLVGAGPGATQGALEQVALADRLAQFGWENDDPEALLLATRWLIQQPSAVFAGEIHEEPDAPEAAPGVERRPAPDSVLQPRALIERVRQISQDALVLARAHNLEQKLQLAEKSPLSGVMRGSDRVQSRHRWSTTVEFVGEQLAEVRVMGNEAARLQLVVYDEGGEWITGSRGAAAECAVRWKAARDGRFKIVVRNRGPQTTRFRFVLR